MNRYIKFVQIFTYRVVYIFRLLKQIPSLNDETKKIIIWAPEFWHYRYLVGDNFIQDMGIYKALKDNNFNVTIYTKKDIGKFFGKIIFIHGERSRNPYALFDYTKLQYMTMKQLEIQQNKVFITSEEFSYWENKEFMYRKLQDFGVRIPETQFYKLNNIDYAKIKYPILLKEEHSASSKGVFKVSNEKELKNIIETTRYKNENEYLITQQLLNMRKDIRVILVGDQIVLHYWRINLGKEWKPTSTSHGSDVDFEFFPDKWRQWTIDEFKKIGITTGAFDIAWENDDLETEPYILEISPFYQPNPIPPKELKKLNISYGEWKKTFNFKINYHKYHIDNFFRIKKIYIEHLINHKDI